MPFCCTPGPCITNVIATCRNNFSQWESSFLWKLRCHWLKFLRRVAKTSVIQGPVPYIARLWWRYWYHIGVTAVSLKPSIYCLYFSVELPFTSNHANPPGIPMMLPLIGMWECFTTLGVFQDLVCLASHLYGYKMMLPIQWQNWCWKLEARKSDDVSVPVMPITRLISESDLIILLRSRHRHAITEFITSRKPIWEAHQVW